MAIQSFRDLRVWQAAMDLVERVYRLTKAFPKHEMYGLASQIQRAAVSIPSNVAEGHARYHGTEYLQHLAMAQGSLAELDTQVEIAIRLKYVPLQDCQSIQDDIAALGRQLRALRISLAKTIEP